MARKITCDYCEQPIEGSTGYEQRVKEYHDRSGLTVRVRITALTAAKHDADLHPLCAMSLFIGPVTALDTLTIKETK